MPTWVENIEKWRRGDWGRRYYANVRDFEGEEDFFPARVMTGAVRWLEENAGREPFFLQVESFDVHEPFHVPEPYASMYGDGSRRDEFTVWPPYQDTEQMARFMAETTPEELAFIWSQYAGKLTMVDRWLGELLGTLDELSLWEDTVVVVTTDHGHDLGERGVFGKSYPHYDSHANIPLFIWHPKYPGDGGSISALTSTVDLFATVLEVSGAPSLDHSHSRSLLPILEDGTTEIREALLYGTFGQGVCATDGEWSLFKSPEHEGPLYYYSSMIFRSLTEDTVASADDSGFFIPGVDLTQWRVPVQTEPLSQRDFLFHRAIDPQQNENLWEKEPGERTRMLEVSRGLLEEEGTPPEQYARLGLENVGLT